MCYLIYCKIFERTVSGIPGAFIVEPGNVIYIGNIKVDIDHLKSSVHPTDDLHLIRDELGVVMKELAPKIQTRLIAQLPQKERKKREISKE